MTREIYRVLRGTACYEFGTQWSATHPATFELGTIKRFMRRDAVKVASVLHQPINSCQSAPTSGFLDALVCDTNILPMSRFFGLIPDMRSCTIAARSTFSGVRPIGLPSNLARRIPARTARQLGSSQVQPQILCCTRFMGIPVKAISIPL